MSENGKSRDAVLLCESNSFWNIIIIIIIKFKFIPRSFYKNIQLRLTINIKLEIKIEVQNYNSKIP